MWSLLAAVYHLGFAGVKRGDKTLTRSDRFMNPAAAQRAATVLGVSHEDLGHFIFSPPRGASLRISGIFGTTSPIPHEGTPSPSGSVTRSPVMGKSSGWDSLSSFCMGLYEHAFQALVHLINRYIRTYLTVYPVLCTCMYVYVTNVHAHNMSRLTELYSSVLLLLEHFKLLPQVLPFPRSTRSMYWIPLAFKTSH